MFRTDLQIRITFGLGWVGVTDFVGRKCSDLGMGGWVRCNLNVVRLCKSVRNIVRSLKDNLSICPHDPGGDVQHCSHFHVFA